MKDVDVLRLAAGVLQRKAKTIIKGCVGRSFDEGIAGALVAVGRLSVVVDQLEEIADSLDDSQEDGE